MGPGLNLRPLDLQSDTYLQSDTLPNALMWYHIIMLFLEHARASFILLSFASLFRRKGKGGLKEVTSSPMVRLLHIMKYSLDSKAQ